MDDKGHVSFVAEPEFMGRVLWMTLGGQTHTTSRPGYRRLGRALRVVAEGGERIIEAYHVLAGVDDPFDPVRCRPQIRPLWRLAERLDPRIWSHTYTAHVTVDG